MARTMEERCQDFLRSWRGWSELLHALAKARGEA